MCHHKSIGGERTRCHRTSPIKPKPPEPEQCGTQKCHGQVVRRHGLVAVALSFSYDEGSCQCSDTGADMDDEAPSKIEGAKIPDPATDPPHPMSERVIDECRPKYEEDTISLKFKSFRNC